MNKQSIYSAIAASVLAFTHASTNAALTPQLGGDVLVDDLGIMWLADMRLADSQAFWLTTGIGTNGEMNWFTANTWIDAMNAHNSGLGWLDFNDWRLPTTTVPDASCSTPGSSTGTGCAGSEMGHLYYTEFGLSAGTNASTAAATAGFSNLATGEFYWSGTLDGPSAYDFHFGNGAQATLGRGFLLFVVPVRTNTVPVPAALWLFGSGLLGLVGMARRKKA